MQDVLKYNNSIGNLQGILLFESKLFDEKIVNWDAFKDIDKYNSGIQINISAAMTFFEFLGLIVIKNKKITLTFKGVELTTQKVRERNFLICNILLDELINDNIIDLDHLRVV